MYEETIKLLEEKGIRLEEGLREGELDKLKEVYGIEFPPPLKQFLATVLPVSAGFYNWRNFSTENISFIKKIMEYPFMNIHSMAEEVDWCDEWGEEPENKNKRLNEIKEKLVKAPLLIPVYSHRYMPLCKMTKYPIISIHGVDVVYYGESLSDYMEIEFGSRRQTSLEYSTIEYVPFWSDLV